MSFAVNFIYNACILVFNKHKVGVGSIYIDSAATVKDVGPYAYHFIETLFALSLKYFHIYKIGGAAVAISYCRRDVLTCAERCPSL